MLGPDGRTDTHTYGARFIIPSQTSFGGDNYSNSLKPTATSPSSYCMCIHQNSTKYPQIHQTTHYCQTMLVCLIHQDFYFVGMVSLLNPPPPPPTSVSSHGQVRKSPPLIYPTLRPCRGTFFFFFNFFFFLQMFALND